MHSDGAPAPAGVQPVKIAILAMGGEGGGVLADWIVDLGEHNGYLAQTTSVPGVAQRTGATIYYVELYPRERAERDGGTPVLALMPLPGDVDVVLASELMEAGRAVQRGLVTPDRTTLIASTHRVFSITEKSAMGDGRVDSDELLGHAEAAAKQFVRFDMAAAAEASGSVISAVLFGALAGTGVLPFDRARFEATIERGGVGVRQSLEAFSAAFGRVTGGSGIGGLVSNAEPSGHAGAGEAGGRADAEPGGFRSVGRAAAAPPLQGTVAAPQAAALDGTTDAPPAEADMGAARPRPVTPRDPEIRALLDRVRTQFPEPVQPLLIEGVRRTVDYQDPAYARLYLDRMVRVCAWPPGEGRSEGEGSQDGPERVGSDQVGIELVSETARHLALWMTYEDTIRVAQLKTRDARFARVRGEVRVKGDQVLQIREYMHPRLQEICETLPAAIGRRLLASSWARGVVGRLTGRGRVITTSSIGGFLMLYTVAGMKRWRRSTLRFEQENARVEQWLDLVGTAAAGNRDLAIEIARCQRLVKGYSETHERGLRNYETLMSVVRKAGPALAPATLRELRDAALADERGEELRVTLARHALA
jgi:indolepyruvate ferredoxin oxidoreductase beta subunit